MDAGECGGTLKWAYHNRSLLAPRAHTRLKGWTQGREVERSWRTKSYADLVLISPERIRGYEWHAKWSLHMGLSHGEE